MVDGNREEIIKKQVQKEELNGSTANMLSSSIKHTGNLSLSSPAPLPRTRSHLTSAACVSVQDSNADFQGNDLDFRGEIGDHLQHNSQECYRNSHKTPNPQLHF